MDLEALRDRKAFICDMDGVIYHGNRLLPGVTEFVAWLKRESKQFLFLTNSSERSPRELHQKLARLGLDVPESHFMDTDIIAGIEAEIETVLVLSGVTTREGIARYAYRPGLVLDGVGEIL